MVFDVLSLCLGGFMASSPEVGRHHARVARLCQVVEPWKGSVGLTLCVIAIFGAVRGLLTLTQVNAGMFLLAVATSIVQFSIGSLLGASHVGHVPLSKAHLKVVSLYLDRVRRMVLPHRQRLSMWSLALAALWLMAS